MYPTYMASLPVMSGVLSNYSKPTNINAQNTKSLSLSSSKTITKFLTGKQSAPKTLAFIVRNTNVNPRSSITQGHNKSPVYPPQKSYNTRVTHIAFYQELYPHPRP